MRRPTRIKTTLQLVALVLLTTLAVPATARAGSVSMEVPFELDRWIDLDVTDGPVTLHRMRIERLAGGVTRAKILRPGNDQYLETLQLEIEYSNTSSKDWEVEIDVRWIDRKGVVIDGFTGDEDLDNDERYDDATTTIATLRYGLSHAKTLVIDLEFERE